MSDSTWSEINLDELKKPLPEIEIEEEGSLPEKTTTPAANIPVVEEDEDDEAPALDEEPRKRLTRSQRLKLQRDQYASELRTEREERERLSRELANIKQTQEKATSDGYDYYIQSLEREGQSLRKQFEIAYAAGEADKVWEVQEALADLKARKVQAEAERSRLRPTQGQSGGEAEPPTQRTTTPTQPPNPSPSKPSPLAVAWINENKAWLEAHPPLQITTRAIGQQLISEGYDPGEPEYFDELTRRVQQYIPQEVRAPKRSSAVTIQNRSTPTATSGKVKVTITQLDRQMAEQLGISIEAYARQKMRREAAALTSNEYTEIT
jgi:hypothetical protein